MTQNIIRQTNAKSKYSNLEVVMRMNDKSVKAVPDTGSPVTVISEALIKELRLKVTGSSNLEV